MSFIFRENGHQFVEIQHDQSPSSCTQNPLQILKLREEYTVAEHYCKLTLRLNSTALNENPDFEHKSASQLLLAKSGDVNSFFVLQI